MEREALIKSEKLETFEKFNREPEKSRWKSSEFLIYYVIILLVSYFTIKECIIISSSNHPAFNSYSHLLSDGWLFNLKIVKKFV